MNVYPSNFSWFRTSDLCIPFSRLHVRARRRRDRATLAAVRVGLGREPPLQVHRLTPDGRQIPRTTIQSKSLKGFLGVGKVTLYSNSYAAL